MASVLDDIKKLILKGLVQEDNNCNCAPNIGAPK